jgi:dienelactone hydrolase
MAWPLLVRAVARRRTSKDEWALPPNEDRDVARQLDETVESAELFLYPGDRHLFADNSLPDYDENAAALLTERALSFLGSLE